MTVSCALTAMSTRVVGPWYERAPGASFGGVVLGACVAATLLAVRWPFNRLENNGGTSFAMTSVGWSDVAKVWAWSVVCFLVRDAAKVAAHRTLARAGWTPAPSGGRAVGGARWRATQYLSRAETRRVEEAADDALAEDAGGRNGGETSGGETSFRNRRFRDRRFGTVVS